jgi:hypothetical protein
MARQPLPQNGHGDETTSSAQRSRPEKQSRPSVRFGHTPIREGVMRALIFGAILLAVAAAGFHTLISSSPAAAWDAKAATFSERFAQCSTK